jgi:hypothetical protein
MRLALILCLAAACGGHPTSLAKPRELATASDVIEASIAASGGRSRLASIETFRARGRAKLYQMRGLAREQLDVPIAVEVLGAAPHNMLFQLTVKDGARTGIFASGVFGDVAWETNPDGTTFQTGDDLSRALRHANFNRSLYWRQLYARAELAGVREFAGKSAYEVVLTTPGGEIERWYIDQTTLLEIGEVSNGTTTIYGDFHDVDGLPCAFSLTMRNDDAPSMDLKFSSIELNPKIDPAVFQPPPH